MISLFRYLFRQTERDLLPRLTNHLTTEFDRAREIGWEAELVLMRGHVRDPARAEALIEQYKAQGYRSIEEVLAALPEPPPPDWKGRFRRWIQHLEGSYGDNPHYKEDRDTLNQFQSWWSNQ